MSAIGVLFVGALGLIIGSFLNVVVMRHNTGRSILGRSGCLSCGDTLPAYALIPVLSWIFLRGYSACCETRISLQYPIVETATGVSFAVIALSGQGIIASALLCAFAAIMIAIAAYDIRHTIIPDEWVYSASVLAVAYQAMMYPPREFADVLWMVFAGVIVAVPFYALWVMTRGRGIGLGDAKLALSAGFLLGLANGFLVAALSFVIGALVSVFVLLPLPHYRRALVSCGILARGGNAGFTMKSEIPFGPFLIAGIFILWFIMAFYGEGFALALFQI